MSALQPIYPEIAFYSRPQQLPNPYMTQSRPGTYGQEYATSSIPIASAPPVDPDYAPLSASRYPSMPRENLSPYYSVPNMQTRPLHIAKQDEPRNCLLGSLVCRLAKTALFSLATAFFVTGAALGGNVATIMFFASSPLHAVIPGAVGLTCAYCAVKCGQSALRALFK